MIREYITFTLIGSFLGAVEAGLFCDGSDKHLPPPAVTSVLNVRGAQPFTQAEDNINPFLDMEDLNFWKNYNHGRKHDLEFDIYMKCSKSKKKGRLGGDIRVNLYYHYPWLEKRRLVPFLTLAVTSCDRKSHSPTHSITFVSYDASTQSSTVIIRMANAKGDNPCLLLTIHSNQSHSIVKCPPSIRPRSIRRPPWLYRMGIKILIKYGLINDQPWINNWKCIKDDDFYYPKQKSRWWQRTRK